MGGRRPTAFLRDLSGDVAGALRRATRRFLDPASRRMRETLLARALLLACVACAWPLARALHNAALSPPVLVPLLGGLGFALTGIWAWRRRRSSDEGRAMLLLGGFGALAFLDLAREAMGFPSRLWQLPTFLLSAALVDAAIAAERGDLRAPTPRAFRGALYAIPAALALLVIFVPRVSALAGGARLVAFSLYAAATAFGLAGAVAARLDRRAIDRRQRGKLLSTGQGVAFAAIAATALLAHAGSPRWYVALPVLTAAPLSLAAAIAERDLLWVDAFLARSLLALVTIPLAAAAGWGAVRLGGPVGGAAAALLLVLAPAAAGRLHRLHALVFGRGDRRRARSLGALAERLAGSIEPVQIAAAARAYVDEAFPGVETALLAEDAGTGSFIEAVPEGARSARLTLAEDHPLSVYFHADARVLTRYEVLAHAHYTQVRTALLREMDEVRAAAIFPCLDGGAVRGLLLLGGQVRGGFFSAAEVRDAQRAASILGAALARARATAEAASRIVELETALSDARAQAQTLREQTVREEADLEESTQQILKAYDELKTRSAETKEARARMATSGPIILAGRAAARVGARIETAIKEGEAFLREHRTRAAGPQADKILARLGEARRNAQVLGLLARSDPESPSDLGSAVDAVVGVLASGWKGRISLDRKIEGIPPIAWPRGALLTTLFHLLMNAEEAIEERGAIVIDARPVEGRAMTLAEAQEGAGRNGLPLWNTEGKRAWASGAARVELTIRDEGRGIRPEDHVRLFDPFFTTRPAASGALGLGLAAVADVLARHGGSIRVESEPHAGSAFILELPAAVNKERVSLAGGPGSAGPRPKAR